MNNDSVLDIYGVFRNYNINYSITSQDYFVHMLRFNKIADIAKDEYILDIGCGKHLNLLKAICQMNRGPMFKGYIGTDYTKVVKWRPDYKPTWDKSMILDDIDFTNEYDYDFLTTIISEEFGDEPFIITCFEVLEHMDFEMQNVFVYNLSKILHKFNVKACYFSTPNFNGNAANNHISELSYALEEEMFDRYDIQIVTAQGLSVYQKYCKTDYLDDGNKAPLYLEQMPLPIKRWFGQQHYLINIAIIYYIL